MDRVAGMERRKKKIEPGEYVTECLAKEDEYIL
jgi:hypothetical protein